MADSDIIERLVVQFDADVDKLLNKMNSINKSVHSSADGWKKELASVDLGAGWDKIVNTIRSRVLEEGGSQIGVLGGALDKLGIVGLAAGAALGALALGIEEAKKTAEWAEDLERASKALGLTTTQLQEFDFIAKAIGVPVESMRSSLGGLERTIGQVETGAGKAKAATQIFVKGLHITPEDLKGWGDLDTQLPHILDALSKVDNEARLAFAAKLRIDPAVLNSLIEARGHLSDLTDQAHRYGIIVDEGVIQKSAEAAEKLHVASEVIDKELKVAFAGLVGPLAQGATLLAEFTVWLGKIPALGESARLALIPLIGPMALLIPGSSGPKQFVTPKMMADFQTGDKPPGSTPFVGGGGAHKGSKFDITKADLDAIATAQAAELRARQALTQNAEARLAIEEQLLATEVQKKKDDLDRQVIDHKLSAAAAATAKAALDKESDEKRAALQRQAGYDIEDRQIEIYRLQQEAAIDELQAQADMAATQGEREKIERQILALRQQLAKDLRDTQTDRNVKNGLITPEQGAATKAAGDQIDNTATRKLLYDQTYQPIHDALDAAVRGGWPGLVSYMASKLEESLIDVFAKNLTQQFLGGGSGGGGNIFATALSFLGLATGGEAPVGTPYWVGERGPELRVDKTPGTILPNHMLGALGGGVSGRGASVANITVHVDAKNALVTQHISAMVQQGVAVGLAQAQPQWMAASSAKTRADLGRGAARQLR